MAWPTSRRSAPPVSRPQSARHWQGDGSGYAAYLRSHARFAVVEAAAGEMLAAGFTCIESDGDIPERLRRATVLTPPGSTAAAGRVIVQSRGRSPYC